MRIIIDDHQKLGEIQQAFGKHFPFLKLVFFGLEYTGQNPFVKENRIENPDKTLGMIRKAPHNGVVFIHGNQRVDTFEALFMETFGINLQVYRKSGNVWLQTEASNSRTLSELNGSGLEMEIPAEKEAQDFDQYHEQL